VYSSSDQIHEQGKMWMGGKQLIFRLSRNGRITLLVIIIIVFILTLRYIHLKNNNNKNGWGSGSLFEIPHHVFGRPSDFKIPTRKSDWYEEHCYPRKLGISISDVYQKLEHLKDSKDPDCFHIWTLFNTIFSLEFIEGKGIKLPEEFQSQVKGWLGHDAELFKQIYNQVSMLIFVILRNLKFDMYVFFLSFFI
jgi:hypothetical protein